MNNNIKRKINGYFIATVEKDEIAGERTVDEIVNAYDNQIPSVTRKCRVRGGYYEPYYPIWCTDDGEDIKEIEGCPEKAKRSTETIHKAFDELIQYIEEGDEVLGIVKGIHKTHGVFFEIFPNFTALMRNEKAGNTSKYNKNRSYKVRIDKIDKDNKRISLSFDSNDANVKFGGDITQRALHKWCEIPANIIEEYKNITESDATQQEIEGILDESYSIAVSEDYILVKENSITFYIKDKKTQAGGPLSAGIKKSSFATDKEYYVNFIGSSGALPTHSLEMYANLGNWRNTLRELSADLLEEKWSFGTADDFYILDRYLNYTFYCAKEKGIVQEKDPYSVFDTGLVSKSYEPIYCGFRKSTSGQKKWDLVGFFKWGASGTGKIFFQHFGNEAPDRLRLYDQHNLDKLIFDIDKAVVPDYDHIFDGRHIARYPKAFILRACGDEDRKAIEELYKKIEESEKGKISENKEQIYDEISDHIIKVNPWLKTKLMDSINGAINLAITKCAWNYKTAIPVFYHRTNNISLLLPLCLVENNVVDVALVVEKQKDGKGYFGHTILTLEMAYMNARQICRPDSDWLIPDKLKGSVFDE